MTWPVEALAAAVGGRSNLVRMIDGGNVHRAYPDGLTDRQADRWAVRCGLHPFEVWPDMLDAAIEVVSVECGWCQTPFVPKRHDQRGCTSACSSRIRQRRRRMRPEVRQANAERARRYYRETADYSRAARRRRYAANPEPERERARRQIRTRAKSAVSS